MKIDKQEAAYLKGQRAHPNDLRAAETLAESARRKGYVIRFGFVLRDKDTSGYYAFFTSAKEYQVLLNDENAHFEAIHNDDPHVAAGLAEPYEPCDELSLESARRQPGYAGPRRTREEAIDTAANRYFKAQKR